MWGSLSGTIGRASHSLVSRTKGARSTREVEGQQRLAALAHEHSCTLAVEQVQVLLHQACLNRVVNDTLYSTPSPLQYNMLLVWKGEGQQEEGSFERSLVV